MCQLTTLILTLFWAVTLFAEVKPAGVFSDKTVLQQGAPVRIKTASGW